jgi:hypothetical protein
MPQPESLPPLIDDDWSALLAAYPDMLKGLGIGAARGAVYIAGLPGDFAGGFNRSIDKGAAALGLPVAPANYDLGTSGQIQRDIEGYTGPFYEPQTPYGQAARRLGEGGVAYGVSGLGAKAVASSLSRLFPALRY